MSDGISPLHRYIDAAYGGNFLVKNTDISVGLTSTQLAPNNYDRLSLVISNYGANDIYVWPGELPAGAQGIHIASGGGVMTLTAKDDLVLVGYDWHGVGKTGTSTALVIAVNQY